MTLPLVPLSLADIVINTFLYGIFFLLNLVSVWFICFPLRRRAERGPGFAVLKKPMLIGALTLFVTVTAHWVCNVLRLFQAMIYFKQGTAPLEYYADLSQRLYPIKTGLIMASIFAGDIMIIYRLWVVWSCQYYIIILPSITLIGLAISGSGITYQLSHSMKGKNIFVSSAQAWVICEGLFTVLTNVYCTGLIAWRIWYTNRHSVPPGRDKSRPSSTSRHLMAAMVIFIESALLYSSFLLVFIGTYVGKQHTESLIADCLPSVAGIAFSFINVRAYLFRVTSASQLPSTLPSIRWHTSRSNDNDVDEELPYPKQPLAVRNVHPTESSNYFPASVESSKVAEHGTLEDRVSVNDHDRICI
ncbi:hypothetical protein E1B28_011303 [Marasmius oreades]|uniref:Uncharacterized protein n=1 Tax=Marasmius oreades TaxID=181124 RepID=A0A9P7UR23_9AGAR|nr:uncharacterized protein E1B28_011303 [Marasmius oreades]KAG7089641.1 hypothetical protein E1B28_011303 [Marasmius oreades]